VQLRDKIDIKKQVKDAPCGILFLYVGVNIMYKVMIVDDEPIIVEGLSRSITWEKWNCQVIATANDSNEAKRMLKKFQPHIMFTDIYMPEMNGLQLIAAIKSEYEDLEISILTGYRDFDYAQQAIRLGITRFLLKPSNMEDLEEAIGAMCTNLKKKNIHGDEKVQAEQGSSASSFIVRNALIYIEENYAKKLSLNEVAEKTYVSQWHLSKLLNRHTGKSFLEILNNVRMKEARKLLLDPALRIGDIAEAVGFFDMAHFSRVFKKQMGISANEYRNKVLGKGN
jgi:YesN/AraC family two-component response regulator